MSAGGEWLDALDPYQRAAVLAPETRVRCLAGAGSGKTRVLTTRIAHLIRDRGVRPTDVNAVTFSKKAATELVERLDGTADGATVGTLHSLAYRILRSARPGLGVADDSLRTRLVRKAIQETTLPRETPVPFAKAIDEISRAKRLNGERYPGERQAPSDPRMTAIGRAYSRLLFEAKSVDFDDMVLEAGRLLATPAGRNEWAGRWAHLLIDEVQDTSPLQWTMIAGLVTPETTIMLVGDVSQSIYGFNGAAPALVLDDERFGPFTTYELRRNYRSEPEIIAAANRLIAGCDGAVLLEAARPAAEGGSSIEVLPAIAGSAAIERVLDELVRAHEGGAQWRDLAVLCRTNALLEPYESACLRRGIPAEIVGGFGFYRRSEVQDVIAYLRLARGWDDAAADRVFNRPSRYLGAAFKAELDAQGGWAAVARHAPLGFSKRYMRTRLADFEADVATIQMHAHGGATPDELVECVMDELGYVEWLRGEATDEVDESRVDNVRALLDAATRYETLDAFLAFLDQAIASSNQSAAGADRVQLSTVHRAKGLEWPTVVVHSPNMPIPHKDADLAEERRVVYVALTRARDRMLVVPGSQYLQEIGLIAGSLGVTEHAAAPQGGAEAGAGAAAVAHGRADG